MTVLVQGTGAVGAALARLAAEAGARVLVSDVDAERAARVAAEVSGEVVAPDDVLTTACDVFAPCAIARVVDEHSLGSLACRIIAGAANDTLAERSYADRLAARGITFVPDFIANAGGVIHIEASRAGWDEDKLRAEVLRCGERAATVLAEAAEHGGTPLDAAEALVRARIDRARRAAA
jgi:leucine dehydrogenase